MLTPRDIIPSCLPKEDESRQRLKGGPFPLASLILALIARGEAVALGALSGTASYSVKKRLGSGYASEEEKESRLTR